MPHDFRILLMNGPNLNLLGQREPGHYGQQTLAQIVQDLQVQATKAGAKLIHVQHNNEGSLIDAAQQTDCDFIIINPAAYTHTSIALRDALLAVAKPFIEVHLSNVHARESFRHHSYFSDVAIGVICGLGAKGYQYALDAALAYLAQQKQN